MTVESRTYNVGRFCPTCDSVNVTCDERKHSCLDCGHSFMHRDPETGLRYKGSA